MQTYIFNLMCVFFIKPLISVYFLYKVLAMCTLLLASKWEAVTGCSQEGAPK